MNAKGGDSMRILHVSPRYYPVVGGSERYCQQMSERLVSDGHQVTVLTTDALDIEYFWDPSKSHIAAGVTSHNGVRIHRLPVRHLLSSKWSYGVIRRVMTWLASAGSAAAPGLLWLCRWTPWVPDLDEYLSRPLTEHHDVIHCTNIPFESLVYAASRYATRCGIPLVLTPFMHLGEPQDHAVRRYYSMPHQVALVRKSDCTIVQTDLERDYLSSLGVASDKMHKVGVGVETKQLIGGSGARFRARHDLHGPIVFYIGVQAFDKGTVHLIEAMMRLWQQGCDADLVLAGSAIGSFERFYRNLPNWARHRCLRLGFIPEEEKRDLLDAGDVLAMPSRTDSFGIVYLEAWLYRKPVIGALAGGVPEVIRDGENGCLVPFGDVPRLAETIHSLLADHVLAARLGARGYAEAQYHSWDRKYGLLQVIYSDLVTTRAQSTSGVAGSALAVGRPAAEDDGP
jgi:glycogen(starch) synthase